MLNAIFSATILTIFLRDGEGKVVFLSYADQFDRNGVVNAQMDVGYFVLVHKNLHSIWSGENSFRFFKNIFCEIL